MIRRWASVVLLHSSFVHKDRVFTYEIPAELDVGVGSVVRVPFARSRTTGVVTKILSTPDVEKIVAVLTTLGPGIGPDGVSLARWLADRYLSSFGEALAAVVPERVAAAEKTSTAAPMQNVDADLSWVKSWTGGGALARTIDGGAGSFSLQPPGDATRAPMIASFAKAAVAAGRRALILVPEVRVQSEVVDALAQAFGDAFAWLGTDRSPRERYREWLAARRGDAMVVAGGRAAALAPVAGLGLVVVDDESHHTYKERRAPRFHARTVAAHRARAARAVLVAIGVPPSIEVVAAVQSGAMTAVAPPRRTGARTRPPVQVIDLSKEPERLVPSSRMLSAAQSAMRIGGRVAILSHKSGEDLERLLARAVRVLKPKESARLDAKASAQAIRRALAHAQLIVATPVIAKDLPIERLALLGICHADAALAQTDFRAAEETFSTWWRVARFAEAIAIETANPRDDAVKALIQFNPASLAAKELLRRKALGYPPFGALARVTTPVANADQVARAIGDGGGAVLGPVVRGENAVLAIKATSRAALEKLLGPFAEAWRSQESATRIDVDPRTII